ncbi:protein-disulfide isomerase [Rahnella sp. BIGb0236]|uniref:DsbA family protein n=1 Tax=Rahnella sp. BIGb0236 TaxID=2485117 RepID=UPI0010F0EB37|nr:DsbA family protein [Rahnella sp. BIGb0236]TDS84891.1 protein-disulfide isomerase [Rahnella sp. BIGb0236]
MKLNSIALAVLLVTGTMSNVLAIAGEPPLIKTPDVNPQVTAQSTQTQSLNGISAPANGASESETAKPLVPTAESVPDSADANDNVASDISAGNLPEPITQTAPNTAPFTTEQKKWIGEAAKDYLMAHPETLLEISQKLDAQLQEQQIKAMIAAVLRHQDALLDDKSTPSYGPDDAKVALIEFFDYQCKVCARQAPVLEAVMKENPKVRYVFKEWPIFAQHWEPSLTAAKTGLQVWQQKGADAYLTYHNAIFATGHNEGKLRQEDINRIAASAGKLKDNNDEALEVLSRTDELAINLGFRGTPSIIVMPVNGATAENVTIIPGGADSDVLNAAIGKALGE